MMSLYPPRGDGRQAEREQGAEPCPGCHPFLSPAVSPTVILPAGLPVPTLDWALTLSSALEVPAAL